MASNFRALEGLVLSLTGKTKEMKLAVKSVEFMREWFLINIGDTIYLDQRLDYATFKVSRALHDGVGVCGILESNSIYGLLMVVKRDDHFELCYRRLIEE